METRVTFVMIYDLDDYDLDDDLDCLDPDQGGET